MFQQTLPTLSLISAKKLSLVFLGLIMFPLAASADFFYSYGEPSTPLNDGYIVSTSNVSVYQEGSVRTWKPNVGGSTLATTTPGVVVYHFPFAQHSATIALWMNMPTFHWSYSRGHNFLYGSVDGLNWEQIAEVEPPAFGSARDLGTVNVPQSLIGAKDFWLKAELFSYGSSASSGGVLTNTSQLSRYDVNSNNTAFSLTVTSIPEPISAIPLCLLGSTWFMRRRRR